MSSSSSCLGRAAVPVKRVWRGLSSRLGRRRRRATGKLSTYVPVATHPEDDDMGVLGRLRKEVRTCEYRDVHVMWEMLSSSTSNGRCGSRDDMADDVAAAVAGGKKGAALPAAARRARRKGRKPAAPWSRLVAYCGGAF